ncbi:MAG TPA: hypothetical protein VGJ36_04635 [Gemmatimonadales bacterium]
MARNKDEAINSCITDMLSLEEHIDKAVRGQREDLEDYPEITRDLKQILHKVEQHESDLKNLSDRRNARAPADAIKRAGSTLLGFGAAAVGPVVRFLREDGLAVRENVLPEISRTIEEIWHSESDQAPWADETSVSRSR